MKNLNHNVSTVLNHDAVCMGTTLQSMCTQPLSVSRILTIVAGRTVYNVAGGVCVHLHLHRRSLVLTTSYDAQAPFASTDYTACIMPVLSVRHTRSTRAKCVAPATEIR